MLTGRTRRVTRIAGTGIAVAALATASVTGSVAASERGSRGDAPAVAATATTTPIKHLVVIFQENVSFDHYFATYPVAANLPGENAFSAAPETPTVNGLSGALLSNNPNLSNPQRLDPAQAATCDQDHGYTHEQQADDAGAMDMFVQDTGKSSTLQQCLTTEHNPAPVTGPSPNYAVMDYFDGNTVTALWNYAQNFAMSDNSWGTNFGPSTPGAINVTGGNTYGAICGPSSAVFGASPCTVTSPPAASPGTPAAYGTGTNYSDADPAFDMCSNGGGTKYTAPATSRWEDRTSAISCPRAVSLGDGSKAGLLRLDTSLATPLPTRSPSAAPDHTPQRRVLPSSITSLTTSRSSTGSRPPTRITPHRVRLRILERTTTARTINTI